LVSCVHGDLPGEGAVGVGLDVELVGGLLAGLDVDHADPDLLIGRQAFAGHDELGALGAGEHQGLGGGGRRDGEDEEPGEHEQELGEQLASHQGDASLRQAWLAMV
jgi:GAF domain-containing protein